MVTYDLVLLADGRRLRLQGLQLPAVAVRPRDARAALRAHIVDALAAAMSAPRDVWLRADPAVARGDSADIVGTLHLEPGSPSINEGALAAGLAVYSARSREVAAADELLAAARRAQLGGRGLWGRQRPAAWDPVPYLNGAVLGLHYESPAASYEPQLEIMADAGFRHCGLLFSAFLPDHRSHAIDRFHRRTVTDARLLATIGQARDRGMSVMLLPIVLLEDDSGDHWRGTLDPADPEAFWLAYDAFLCHYLDLAEAAGVQAVSVGSEFGSLEGHTAAWRRIIRNARGRFRGSLTYSVNWDHLHGPQFVDDLDLLGVTGYFSLTEDRDPTREELVAAWRRVGGELERALERFDVPVFFSELGYASQNGTNTDPWNYLLAEDDVDVQEQADCFAAFLAVVDEFTWLRGAYFYDLFDQGGADDHTYSPRGKPAMDLWRRWARRR